MRAGRPGDIQPALRALWAAYRAGRSLGPAEGAPILRTSIRYAGATLIDIAFGAGRHGSDPTVLELHHLQVADNILWTPLRAGVRLFGFDPAELAGAR